MEGMKKLQVIWLSGGLGKGTEDYEEAKKKYQSKFSEPPGYNKVVENPDWREMGLFCEWEHCIEMMLLRCHRDENSCPIFGHDCPGGPKRTRKCVVESGRGKVEEVGEEITTWCERCKKETLHERHKYAQKKICLECALIIEHVGR